MKRIVPILIIALLLGGCAKANKQPAHRVVTGVQVHYEQKDASLYRTYTDPTSIRSILTYLRILRPFGPVIPEGTQESTCRITLQYSHGPDSVYLQHGREYLRRDDGYWQHIDSSYASLLYPLLLLLPSDG